ncbi:HisA/HisF-related TIM barrel protein [Escherichia coli]
MSVLTSKATSRWRSAAGKRTRACRWNNWWETYLPVGLKHVLCTDISRDGTLAGSNVSFI